ncbi:MAG TPA: rod shape-determining protein MreC [Candidatus Pacearchaeota archaeon]|jgi:rod shape-determining protein MreC|nr:rod shape-determining protein MreC [Candidatus Pacearchaeota archaeon]HRR94906.1 rod shape-determining protein MreC [Candidatus Paceibacterota bacterium]HPC30546.1 rod shape-determining protein MreC [Candidatus Pacearchaeota archaeon]HQG09373.1 rod shape-determining protein MreC [Candidatus Pacearchaeota archaeon]HQH20303.1 rod shape-determining protein MreC [Candidatus Pacearchaeota archaeon]
MKFESTRKIFIGILILALLFLALNFWGSSSLKNFFYNQTFGLQTFLLEKGKTLSFCRQDQVALNQQLIQENQKLLSDLADLDSLKKENEILRQALNIGLAGEYQVIFAEITAINNFNLKGFVYGDSILINKGSNSGVQKGFPAVLANKILLGKVVEVYPDFSRIALITNKDSVIDVQVQDNPEYALAKGEGNQKLILDMFPKDKELKSGTLVITSALGGAYPSGLVVGRIGDVSAVSSEAFRKAEIIPVYDLRTTSKIFIIKNVVITNE